jgi:hypothetical protein
MITPAHIAHHIPGRARFLIPDKRGDAQYFAWLADEFSRIDSVRKVKTNPDTGSLTVEFTDDLSDLVQSARAHDLFSVDPDQATQSETPAPLEFSALPVNLVTGREIDAMFMLGTAMGAAGLFQLMRGRVLVPAMSFFWYAMQAFSRSGKSTGKH